MTTRGRHASFDLKKALAGAQLPALPQSAIRLLELSRDPDNTPAEFAVAIEADPGLAGQVLRFVNSSYFGFARKISSVKLAITLVGIRTIKNFSLWSAVFSLMPNPKCGPFELKSLWQDSLRRALFARAIARQTGFKQSEEVFAAALLQDMAVPVLAKAAPDQYVRLLQARNEGSVRLSALEKDAFGWTHAEAAGLMARQWNLPEEFALLIESHLVLDRQIGPGGDNAGGRAVALSALLPSTVDHLWADHEAMEEWYRSTIASDGPTIHDLFEQVDREYDEFAPVLKVSTPSRSLGRCLEEAAGVTA